MPNLTKEQNDEINDAVMCETRRAMEKAGHSMPKIAKELAIIAYSDPNDYYNIDEGGAITLKPLKGLKKKSRAIKKIREKTNIAESADGSMVFKKSTVELELHDKLDMLKFSATLMGMVKPTPQDHRHSGTIIVDTGIRRPMDDPGWTGIVEPGATSGADIGKNDQ
jgi:hypothetical protein